MVNAISSRSKFQTVNDISDHNYETKRSLVENIEFRRILHFLHSSYSD